MGGIETGQPFVLEVDVGQPAPGLAAGQPLLAQLVHEAGLAGPAHAGDGRSLAGQEDGVVHPARCHLGQRRGKGFRQLLSQG
ncbi:MAG: hypothetical protein AB1634_16640 [Thermodesulfobacteriota bacterium]